MCSILSGTCQSLRHYHSVWVVVVMSANTDDRKKVGEMLCLILQRPHPLISCFKSLYPERPQLMMLRVFVIYENPARVITLPPVPPAATHTGGTFCVFYSLCVMVFGPRSPLRKEEREKDNDR